MNRYGKRCVLYPRVSTEMQVDGYSLEGQKNMLTRFADREEMIVVDTYEDAGKSGKSIEGRPAFQKMLRDIEDGLDIDYILVYKLSRFGRNAADILNSLELVQSYGVNLICIEEGIDSSQTSGKLLISVLSAVAEIERENIIEQTMNGRREKARQGGWNGGFAPYGYTLEDNKLMIEETEAVAIRKIFELYTSSEIGLGGIANQLNLQGIRKIPRQNGTLEDWTGHFIKLILDNPVYCGKIAYGRRTKEKVKGTKNDYQMKRNDDYILTEGQHKGIVSEEVWEKAHAKRLRTGVKQPSKIGRDRVHLLSGLLKCPVCGSPMYTNKHAWTNKDGTYKEIYYYVCSRNRMVRGKHCEYKAMLKKTDIEPMVIEAIREIVRNEEYAQAIKKRVGVQIDTKAVDKELEGYQAKLKEVDLNKTRLEREIDSLPADAKYRERKLHDMTLRLDSLYDVIVELEEKIEDARLRRDAIKQQAITLENIYKIMVNFDCVYNIINDEEKRNVVTALIKEIEIYRNDESEYPLKRIGLNFPVFKDGGEVTELLWDKGNTVESYDIPGKTISFSKGMIMNMLSNERYCGDAILQKSVTVDCIEKKRKKNTGEAPMYYVQNNHPAIIDRVTFNKVQEELARRKTKTPGSAKSSITSTGKYSRYALTDVLICGNCGTRYRRVTWSRNGTKRIVWRCISRLDYGKKYCSDSPTIMEDKLQEAIVRAVNKFNKQDNATYKALMRATISEALGLNGDPEEVDMLERKVEALNNKMLALVNESVSSGDGIEAHESEFMTLSQETELLKQRIAAIQESTAKDNGEQSRLEQIQAIISERESKCMEYDDSIVRQMVECIKVYPGGKLEIIFGGGYLVEESV